MKKHKKNMYEKYFGRNFTRIIYLISCGLLGYGVFSIVVGNQYWGAIFCTIGILPFFLTSHKQVSDKHMDELVNNSHETYLEKNIKGKMIGKRELNPADFSVFSGFIRDGGDVRFKACRDGKVRTSKYYVTAISVNKTECIVSTTLYNLLSDETPVEKLFAVKSFEEVAFEKNETEFPKGNYECILRFEQDSIKFYLPTGDYLVEQLTKKINALYDKKNCINWG